MLTPTSNFHLGVFSASADVGAVTSAFARGGWVVSEPASLDDCARTTGDTVSNARPTTRVTARLREAHTSAE